MIAIQSLYFALAILFGIAVWRAWYNGRENVAWFIWAPLAVISIFLAVDGGSVRQLIFGIVYVVIVVAIFMAFRQLIARHRSEVVDLSADDTVRLDGAR